MQYAQLYFVLHLNHSFGILLLSQIQIPRPLSIVNDVKIFLLALQKFPYTILEGDDPDRYS